MKEGTKIIAQSINDTIKDAKDKLGMETDLISDGFHTFGDLYDFRLAYNAMAFNFMYKREVYVALTQAQSGSTGNPREYGVHKSWKHHDGEYCFGKEKKWFIVAAKLPTGTITNHYKAEHWDLFKVPEVEKSLFPFDGHTAPDVLERIFEYLKK